MQSNCTTPAADTAPPKGPPDTSYYRESLKDVFAALHREYKLTVCNGKAPIGTDWQHQRLSIDEAERRIDSASHPAIGLQLGPGGAIDFDVDGPDEKVAFCWLFEDDPLVMPAYTSGRVGGEHYLAAFHPRFAPIGKATIKVTCPTSESMTVRLGAGGKGAHSVMPPSYHCRQVDGGGWEWTGKQYAWKPHLTLEEVGLPTLPDSVVDKILAAWGGPSTVDVKQAPPADGSYGPGNRHDHLCTVAAKVRNAGCGRETILATLRAENQAACNPPKDDYELQQIAAYYAGAESTAPPPPKADARIERVSFAELAAANPTLRPPVIDGILRKGETLNIISSSKVGKSWFLYGLLLSGVIGRDWLGRYPMASPKALLVDNELHPSTLANRIPAVADAMGIEPTAYDLDLEIMSLRGRLKTLDGLQRDLERIEHGEFGLIALDARYRFAVDGESENDNAAQARFYNTIDQIAERTGAGIVLVHHASKGDQGGKKVVDVGAGAGSQSRAADAHLVLREHEDPSCVVLDAAVRSFAPIEPVVLRWQFPLWVVDEGADPRKLAGLTTKGDERQKQRDAEGIATIIDALLPGSATARQLREATGISRERLERLLALAVSEGHLLTTETTIRGNTCKEYRLCPDDLA